jgi:hypothetical protein
MGNSKREESDVGGGLITTVHTYLSTAQILLQPCLEPPAKGRIAEYHLVLGLRPCTHSRNSNDLLETGMMKRTALRYAAASLGCTSLLVIR